MKKLGTRLISAALAACMITSVLPVSAFASEGGTDEETGESAERELSSGEYADIYEPGIYTLPAGTYTGDNAIYVGDLSGVVTINVTGNITVNSDGPFLNIYRDGYADESAEPLDLTLNMNEHIISSTGSSILVINSDVEAKANITVTVNGGTFQGYGSPVLCAQGGTLNLKDVTVEGEEKGTPGAVNAVVCEAGGTVHIDGGSYYGKSQNYYDPTLYNKGTMTVTNATVHSENGNAMYNGGTATITGGNYKSTGENASALSNGNESDNGTMNVINATVCSEQSNAVHNSNGSVTISGSDTLIETPEGSDAAINSKGDLYFNCGTVKAPNGSAIVCNGGTAQINGGTIKDSKKGIAVQGTAAGVVLKSAAFENNGSDIYLAADQSITVKDTFADRATVKAESESYKINGDPNANLVSQNGDLYWVYDTNNQSYTLTQREAGKYFVDAVNATAVANDAELKANTPVDQNTAVTITADESKDGMEFDGWKVIRKNDGQEVMPVQDGNDLLKATFVMPDSDVTVTAMYRQPGGGDPDGGDVSGSGSGAGDALAAVAIGTAAVWGVYEAGTGIYRAVNMNGIPMPANRGELAVLLWEHAGRPEPESTALYADIGAADTTLQKAARWCTEQGLLSAEAGNSFKPDTYVFKLRVCTTWEQAKQKGLIQ